MNIEVIRQKRLAHPFEPFMLKLDDGSELNVRRPFSLGIAPDGSHLGFVDENDRLVRFTADRVISINTLDSVPNGEYIL